ncbi:ABC transporter permease [Anaerobacillus isosaccharinicus]|uniref:ABC transporter permease n=1 Tax=Anaerobacillus isosaccharinicus TaxID=1532552 RepID=A0A1S2ME33_9BACI|nr:ABC transporter permease [Anaerobacillus isosaccharinicus]MBA5586699.1 ABC transporter permease [Anaerobacillus isosaccharinicus]QOY35074.1 ABC transporter permease [Anaerobacillus isosaccharinicus]
MINGNQLFFTRLKKGWLYQYKVWKTAVDWIVWLYILVPVLFIFFIQYHSLYSGQTAWVQLVPLELTWFLLFFLSWTGVIRLFVEHGDLLFLRQNKTVLSSLMKLGIYYSVLKNTFFLIAVFLLLLPFWLIYEGVSYAEISIFFLFVFFFRLCLQLVKQMLAVSFQNWKLLLMNIGFFISSFMIFLVFYLSSFLVKLVIITLVIVSFIFLYKRRLTMTWCFYEDCFREEEQRLKLTSLFLGASGYPAEKRLFRRKKPFLLFPNSMQLYKDRTSSNIMTELFLKFLLRSKTRLLFMLRMTGIFTFALTITPFSIKWILLPVCMFSFIHFTKTGWRELKNQPFFKLFLYKEHDETVKAVKKTIGFVTLPSCFIFGFTVGLTNYSLTVGGAVAILSALLAFFYIKREMWIE